MDLLERLQTGAHFAGAAALLGYEWATTRAVYNPLSRRFQRDPYATYERLREEDPWHRSHLVGGWVVSRYRDVLGVLRDPRLSSDDRHFSRYRPDENEEPPMMLRLDGEDHARQRALVTKAFTPRAIERLRPRIEALVDELLASVAHEGRMDVIRDLAYPLPVTIIAELLGIPAEDRARFKHWSDEVVRGMGTAKPEDLRRSDTAASELKTYLSRIADARSRADGPDILSVLMRAENEGDRLSRPELLQNLILLLVAGNETTTNLIGNGMLALLRQPEQLELLRREPARMPAAVEELLRYDSPVQATSRMATKDLELGHAHVKKGQQLIVLLGAANRDPDAFPDAERLDVTRDARRHLAFGHGTHFCMGAALARLEGQIALSALVERFPAMKLATETPDWGDNLMLRGVRSLPVAF